MWFATYTRISRLAGGLFLGDSRWWHLALGGVDADVPLDRGTTGRRMHVSERDSRSVAQCFDHIPGSGCIAGIDDADLLWQDRLLEDSPHAGQELLGPVPCRNDERRA